MAKDWVTKPLGDITDFFSGGTPNKSTPSYWGGEMPWVTVKDMKSMRLNGVGYTLTDEGAKTVRIAPTGSVLILVRGMGLFKDLPVVVCDRPVTFNQDIKALVPKSEINSDFLAYSLLARKQDILNHVDAAGHGTGRLDTDLLKSIELFVPPPKEQQKIVMLIRTWDEAIEKTERLIEIKKKQHEGMRERLYAECYHSKDRKKAQKGWTLSSFGQIFEEKKVRNPGLDEMSVITVGKYAIRKQTDHFTRNVSSKDLSNYWLLEPGDFVYDPMSAYYGALGCYDGTDPGIVSPAYRVISLKQGLNPNFVQGLLDTHYILFALEAQSSQGNKSGKRRSLQRGAFNGIKFFLPDATGQKKISNALEAINNEMHILRNYLADLKNQKRGLMQKLLTGEWRVKIDGKSVEAA